MGLVAYIKILTGGGWVQRNPGQASQAADAHSCAHPLAMVHRRLYSAAKVHHSQGLPRLLAILATHSCRLSSITT